MSDRNGTPTTLPVWRVTAEGHPGPEPAGRGWAPDAARPPAERVLCRRQLLRRGFWAGMGVLAAGGLAAAADFLAPQGVQRFGGVVTVPSDRVPKPGAPRSMDTFAIVAVSEGGVHVNTGHLLLGGTDDPQRTVPAGPSS